MIKSNPLFIYFSSSGQRFSLSCIYIYFEHISILCSHTSYAFCVYRHIGTVIYLCWEKKIRLWVSQWNKMQSQQNINLKISHSLTRTVLSRVCDNPGIISLAHTFILISKFSLSLWNSLSEKGRARNDCGLFQIHLLMLTISYWRETKTEKGK